MDRPVKFELNEQTYLWLSNNKGKETEQDVWYQLTYPIFIKQRFPESKDDFYTLVALAYSWMPTIPKRIGIDDRRWLELLDQFQALQIDSSRIASLLSVLVPSVNNSIVGSSKILHFLYPNSIPIIDAGVIENWNHIFSSNESMRLSRHHLNTSDIGKKIDLFIKHTNYMLEWKKACGDRVSLRDIESALFNYQPEPNAVI